MLAEDWSFTRFLLHSCKPRVGYHCNTITLVRCNTDTFTLVHLCVHLVSLTLRHANWQSVKALRLTFVESVNYVTIQSWSWYVHVQSCMLPHISVRNAVHYMVLPPSPPPSPLPSPLPFPLPSPLPSPPLPPPPPLSPLLLPNLLPVPPHSLRIWRMTRFLRSARNISRRR